MEQHVGTHGCNATGAKGCCAELSPVWDGLRFPGLVTGQTGRLQSHSLEDPYVAQYGRNFTSNSKKSDRRRMWLWGSMTWTSMLRKVGTDFVFVLAKGNRTKRVPKFLRMKLSCLWSLNTLRKSRRSRCMTKYSDVGRHIYTYYTSSQPLFCWRTDSCRKSESIATVANLENYSQWTKTTTPGNRNRSRLEKLKKEKHFLR